MDVKRFVDFVVARHSVAMVRSAGLGKPWTKDPILQSYRFCNVYRELDTVTQWIDHHWRSALGADRDAWFAMVVARLINHPDSLGLMKVPSSKGWDAADFLRVLNARTSAGDKAFGSAYIVSTNGHAMPKPAYLVQHVLTPLWEQREAYRPRKGDTLASFHTRLTTANGLGSFMAAQVVADVKNCTKQTLSHAVDWWSWAAPGPGSIRGLARVVNGDKDKKVPNKGFLQCLHILQTEVNKQAITRGWGANLCTQDIQNCLCEFDKYERVRLGEGTPRQKYPGAPVTGELFP